MYRYIFLILLLSILNSCSVTNKVAEKKHEKSKVVLTSIAQNKYKDNYKTIFNSKGDYVIVTKRNKEIINLIPDLNYFVFSMKKKSIMIEDSLQAGNVYWENDYLIKAIEREQKAESPQHVYLFDVKNKVYILN